MIRYALACADGHRFESWFRDAEAFEAQSAQGHLTCPTCASPHVAKTVMAPAVLSARGPAGPSSTPPDTRPSMAVALLDEKGLELRAAIKALREKILTEAQDVGSQFVTEARRMHEGEIPERQIYGEASPAEAVALIEDGILVMPLPRLPDEQN